MRFGFGVGFDVRRRFINPLAIPNTLDLWVWHDLAHLWTTDALTTNVSAAADPVGAWRGLLNAYTLSTATASNRPEYSATGILLNSTSVYKELQFARAVANNAPLTMLMKFTNTSGQHPRFAGYVGPTTSTGIQAGTTIFGRARTGTPLNSTISATGTHCAAVSFDGTAAFLKVDNNAAASITVGTDATSRDTIRLSALLAAATVSTVHYLQAVSGAMSESEVQAWFNWAKAQP